MEADPVVEAARCFVETKALPLSALTQGGHGFRQMAEWIVRHSAIVEAAKAQEAAQSALAKANQEEGEKVPADFHAETDSLMRVSVLDERYHELIAETNEAVRAAARTMEGKP